MKINKLFVLGLAGLALAACAPEASVDTSSQEGCDTTSYADNLHLELEYKGRDFLVDGVGEVVLNHHVDGDTSHFYRKNADGSIDRSVNIKARYECVNTPESTGNVQDWGYDASDYTKEKTMNAGTIVISSNRTDYGSPEVDGNLRHLCYVWVAEKENAPLEDLRLLNLMLVEEGLGQAQGLSDSIYEDVFYAADAKARCERKYIWSGEEDPRVPGSAISTTIQDLVEGVRWNTETEEYEEFDWVPEETAEGEPSSYRVSFPCTVAYHYQDGGDNCYVYADYETLDPNDEPGTMKRYGIYIFGGYQSVAPFRHVGWQLQMNGIVAEFNGNLQITDVHYSAAYSREDYVAVIERTDTPYDAPVVTPTELATGEYSNLIVRVNGLHGLADTWGTYSDEDGDAYTILCADEEGNTVPVRVYSGKITDRNNPTNIITGDNFEDYFCKEGETFNIYGPCVRYVSSSGRETYQLQILVNADLTFND